MLLKYLFGFHAGKSNVDLMNILNKIVCFLFDFELVNLVFFFFWDLNLFINS